MSGDSIPTETVQKMYRTDRAVVFASILVMLGTLFFVLTSVLPQSPPGMIRIVMVGAAIAVTVLSAFALLRVLSHLTRHKEALYHEDIRALRENRHSA